MKHHVKLFGLLILLLVVSIMAGCAKKEKMGTVIGTVKYKGALVTNGQISFRFSERGKGGGTLLKEDGTYSIKPIPVGDYKIVLLPPVPAPPGEGPRPKIEKYIVPVKYHQYETSQLTFTVEPGENTFDINLE